MATSPAPPSAIATASAEVEQLIGDASKAKERLGWTPTVSFPELVAMMVDSDIAAVKAGW